MKICYTHIREQLTNAGWTLGAIEDQGEMMCTWNHPIGNRIHLDGENYVEDGDLLETNEVTKLIVESAAHTVFTAERSFHAMQTLIVAATKNVFT